VPVATVNTAIDNMLLLVSLPRRSMCFKRMLLVSSLHTAPGKGREGEIGPPMRFWPLFPNHPDQHDRNTACNDETKIFYGENICWGRSKIFNIQ